MSSPLPGGKRKEMGEDANSPKDEDNSEVEDSTTINANEQSPTSSKMPKLVNACSTDTSLSEIFESQSEEEAIFLTKLEPEEGQITRKLVDFSLFTKDGDQLPFENVDADVVYITAFIAPMDNNLEEENDMRVLCKHFGPVVSRLVSGYTEGAAEVFVTTDAAHYLCFKPAESYKIFYQDFSLRAHICVAVYEALAKSLGGDPNLTLEELLTTVSSLMSGYDNFNDGPLGQQFVVSIGEFIYDELIFLDGYPENDYTRFSTLPVLCELKEQSQLAAKFDEIPSDNLGFISDAEENHKSEVSFDEHVWQDDLWEPTKFQDDGWKPRRQQQIEQILDFAYKFYIKISEDEIADDYPLPAYFNPSVQEKDEYIYFEGDSVVKEYYNLPTKDLYDWSLYNSDMRLVSLELLPLQPHTENDDSIFGSGSFIDVDGSNSYLETDACLSSSMIDAPVNVDGTRIYLSEVKECVILEQARIIYIRTDMSWYCLRKPAKQYAPWYEPVLKTARLAHSILTLIKEDSHESWDHPSFSDVIVYVSEFEKDHPSYISNDTVEVERYILVHGQIILTQFAKSSVDVSNCAFTAALSSKMEERRHTKLVVRAATVITKEVNLNPTASFAPVQSKRKVKQATTTGFINRIWKEFYLKHLPEDCKQGSDHDSEEAVREEEGNKEGKVEMKKEPHDLSSCCEEIKWEGHLTGYLSSGEATFRCASVRGNAVTVGGAVLVHSAELEDVVTIVEYMFEKSNGAKMAHGRVMKRGCQTVLGNAANENEMFLTEGCLDFELKNVKEPVILNSKSISWGYEYGKERIDSTKIETTKQEENKKNGLLVEYYCRYFYFPELGTFSVIQPDTIGLGTGACHSCSIREKKKEDFKIDSSLSTFYYKKTQYHVHDFVYVKRSHFKGLEGSEISKSGSIICLKPYVVCHLLEVVVAKCFRQPDPQSTIVKVRRFYRPEDISTKKAYHSDIREIYYSEDIHTVPVAEIEGKCEVRKQSQVFNLDLPVIVDHVFFCECSYDPLTGAFSQLPPNIKIHNETLNRALHIALMKEKRKGKLKEGEANVFDHWFDVPREMRLATLDIFSGCGGLTEGLQQSGVAYTKWAVEYHPSAGESFSRNHDEALVFIDDCNVILRAIMEKCGDVDNCMCTAEVTELAAALDEEKYKNLPFSGQVDLITGGLPCQEFPATNRSRRSFWSEVQSGTILTFLSFVDYLRPRFLLLETGRDFMHLNEGLTFRLTLVSLLEMGFQVKFGILAPGAYGVPQSRESMFLWAASSKEILPEWPEPMHVCSGPEFKLSSLANEQYTVVQSLPGGAPFRSFTVKDIIADLPEVKNGASALQIMYEAEPVSWFQKQVRGSMQKLSDHITKEMEELNFRRCERIPCRPGADWQDLPNEKVVLRMSRKADLMPWHLPEWAKRENEWKGLFGRLDWEGSFPSSIKDPPTMGKVGRCFHPGEDRIVTVRECARAQGFPDRYHFAGDIQNKYIQIGEAVPPLLAYVLGRKLKQVVDAKASH